MKKVYFHSGCLDGATGAYWLSKAVSAEKVIPYIFNQKVEDVCSVDEIYFIDITPTIDELYRLAEIAKKVVIIDHHEEAYKKYASEFGKDNFVSLVDNNFLHYEILSNGVGHISLFFSEEMSGATMGLWFYLQTRKEYMDIKEDKLPLSMYVTQRVADRDMWKFELSDTKEVCRHLSNKGGNSPKRLEEFFSYMDFLSLYTKEEMQGEKSLWEREKIEVEFLTSVCENLSEKAQKAHFDGIAVSVVNAMSMVSSETAEFMYNADAQRVALIYTITDKTVFVSLRNHAQCPITSGEMATRYGGGGHANAAGFKMEVGEFFSRLTFEETT